MESTVTDKDFDEIEKAYDEQIKPLLDKIFAKAQNDLDRLLIYDTISDCMWIDYDIKYDAHKGKA